MSIKIGVFDSGVGGITVLSTLRQRLKTANFVYLGDTAHVPYGTKSPAQIEKLSVACAKILKKKKVDVVVVACNTASSLALGVIKKTMGSVPVFGVVQPGIQAVLTALAESQKRLPLAKIPVLVLATRATVQSHAYGRSLREVLGHGLNLDQEAPPVIEQACPLLVPMIEEGWIDHPILQQTVMEYLRTHVELHSKGIALLGCTHYPWIHGIFQKALPGWTIVNSAEAIADVLEKVDIGKAKKRKKLRDVSIEWIFTDPEAVPSFARSLIER